MRGVGERFQQWQQACTRRCSGFFGRGRSALRGVSLILLTTPAAHDPIPAMRHSLLTLPLWAIYVGSAVCLCAAAILWWRCIAAGECSCRRARKSSPLHQ